MNWNIEDGDLESGSFSNWGFATDDFIEVPLGIDDSEGAPLVNQIASYQQGNNIRQPQLENLVLADAPRVLTDDENYVRVFDSSAGQVWTPSSSSSRPLSPQSPNNRRPSTPRTQRINNSSPAPLDFGYIDDTNEDEDLGPALRGEDIVYYNPRQISGYRRRTSPQWAKPSEKLVKKEHDIAIRQWVTSAVRSQFPNIVVTINDLGMVNLISTIKRFQNDIWKRLRHDLGEFYSEQRRGEDGAPDRIDRAQYDSAMRRILKRFLRRFDNVDQTYDIQEDLPFRDDRFTTQSSRNLVARVLMQEFIPKLVFKTKESTRTGTITKNSARLAGRALRLLAKDLMY